MHFFQEFSVPGLQLLGTFRGIRQSRCSSEAQHCSLYRSVSFTGFESGWTFPGS